MKISKMVTKTSLQAYWEEYNQGLLELSDREVGNKVKHSKRVWTRDSVGGSSVRCRGGEGDIGDIGWVN